MSEQRTSIAEIVGTIVIAALAGYLAGYLAMLVMDGLEARSTRRRETREKLDADVRQALAGPRVVKKGDD